MKWSKKILANPPWFIKKLFSQAIWELTPNDKKNKQVYLTFDDGPHPKITPWVLDLLDQYHAKATFFCVGENIDKYPDTFLEIQKRGHKVGNHTYNHIVGWKNNIKDYVENFEKCQKLTQTNLFRPPHGRITPAQIQSIKNKGLNIILWSALTFDFDKTISYQDCLELGISSTKPGAIIVFHDSEKAWPNLKQCLPKYLQFLDDNEYKSVFIK
ncbi:MAG: polysaccharide deacetylase family protein [Bacteroidales bacterium]